MLVGTDLAVRLVQDKDETKPLPKICSHPLTAQSKEIKINSQPLTTHPTERKKISGNLRLLREFDKKAKSCLERAFWTDPDRLANYTGIGFDPSAQPDYADLITQFHDREVMKREIYNAVGYDSGKSIIYILQHYNEWKEMKDML